jgi:hypothetical protein
MKGGIILIGIAVLVLLFGAIMPASQTVQSRSCDGFTDTCVYSETQAPNPFRGVTMGFGFMLLIVGIVTTAYQSNSSTPNQSRPQSSRNDSTIDTVNNEPSSEQSFTTSGNPRIKVSANCRKDAGSPVHKESVIVRTSDVAEAKQEFVDYCDKNDHSPYEEPKIKFLDG